LSPRAQKAIARAIQLAAEQGAALTILHVLTAETGDKARQRQVALQVEKDLRRDIATLSSAQDRNDNYPGLLPARRLWRLSDGQRRSSRSHFSRGAWSAIH
jgi:hypothetical protein